MFIYKWIWDDLANRCPSSEWIWVIDVLHQLIKHMFAIENGPDLRFNDKHDDSPTKSY